MSLRGRGPRRLCPGPAPTARERIPVFRGNEAETRALMNLIVYRSPSSRPNGSCSDRPEQTRRGGRGEGRVSVFNATSDARVDSLELDLVIQEPLSIMRARRNSVPPEQAQLSSEIIVRVEEAPSCWSARRPGQRALVWGSIADPPFHSTAHGGGVSFGDPRPGRSAMARRPPGRRRGRNVVSWSDCIKYPPLRGSARKRGSSSHRNSPRARGSS